MKSLFRSPVKTVKAVNAFRTNYNDMKAKNVIGGNIPAHEKANKEATKIAGPKVREDKSFMLLHIHTSPLFRNTVNLQ